MATFQDQRAQVEQKVLVHLLSAVEQNSAFTQRNLAIELGIAIGLMNQYLKSCITKGWIRTTQISPRRLTYFLTPQGFAEKSKMVADYLSRSLTFFRDARAQCEEMFSYCKTMNLFDLAAIGIGDLADIAQLVSNGTGIKLTFFTNADQYGAVIHDAVLITDVVDPQGVYNKMYPKIENSKLLTLKLLHISRIIPRDVG